MKIYARLLGELRSKQARRTSPAFASEAEEARWWFENRAIHGKELQAAASSGRAEVLAKEKLKARIPSSKQTASPVVALRIPEGDLILARKQAGQKGLPYQTYIKSILHETLMKRERRKTDW